MTSCSMVAVAGCAGSAPSSSPQPRSIGWSPTTIPHQSAAQPVAQVEDVQQGDPCDVNGATTTNLEGRPFDCEPWGDGVKRWILP
jgi:hypothetical protein